MSRRADTSPNCACRTGSSPRNSRRTMEKLLTAEDVARILHVSTAWVYDHADRKRPQVPSVRLGKAVRFRPEDVQTFIEAMTRRVA